MDPMKEQKALKGRGRCYNIVLSYDFFNCYAMGVPLVLNVDIRKLLFSKLQMR